MFAAKVFDLLPQPVLREDVIVVPDAQNLGVSALDGEVSFRPDAHPLAKVDIPDLPDRRLDAGIPGELEDTIAARKTELPFEAFGTVVDDDGLNVAGIFLRSDLLQSLAHKLGPFVG